MTDGFFREWARRWLAEDAGAYTGRKVPDADQRIERLMALWHEPIPPGWQRDDDHQLTDPAVRYRRHHKHDMPKARSEHELEYEVLAPDPRATLTLCFGARLVDGINAVPLARDNDGKRAGNVEADMLLLTQTGDMTHRLLLVEAKTISNNAWYAVAESLRQLKLYTASLPAQNIMLRRHHDLPESPPVAAVVLAPASFYSDAGARSRAVNPALHLVDALREQLGIDLRLAVWDRANRAIAEISRTPPSDLSSATMSQ